MKKLILSELLLLFLATTFVTDSPPPGWYQQSIPIGNKQITDIQFLDSLNGWVVTNWGPAFDTAYIFKTTDGGNAWGFQLRYPVSFTAIDMVNINTGYASGGTGFGRLFKTTNGGNNWNLIYTAGHLFNDLYFVNNDTGWACDDDPLFGVGIIKTTTGGTNWFQQAPPTYRPQKLFFINPDTGWAGSSDWKLYRTTNGGSNWNLQYTTTIDIHSIFFLNGLKGWIRAGGGNGIAYTTNGGLNWISSQGEFSGGDIHFVTDSIGWAGGGNQPLRITKSTDGGKTWGYQNALATPDISVATLLNDTLLAWAGRQLLIHTNDGGGLITFTGIKILNTEIPKNFALYQNYPNPFNPNTIIKFQILRLAEVRITVYDIRGKEIAILTDKKYNAGTYEAEFNGSNYPSGVYFYTLVVEGIAADTKKMVLVK